MKTYHIVWESRSKVRDVAVSTALCMVFFAAVGLFRRSFNPVDWIAFGVMYAFFAYLFPTDLNYDLEIGDDAIRLLRNGVVKQTVRKGRVRYVREWDGG